MLAAMGLAGAAVASIPVLSACGVGGKTSAPNGAADVSGGFDSSKGLPLVPHEGGNAWVVTQIASPLAASHLWQWLLDPKTFSH